MSNNTHTDIRTAGTLGAGVLLSRALGFSRDVLLAYLLGPAADAFILAFRLPSFCRRFLAEGSLGFAYAAALAEAGIRPDAPQGALFLRGILGRACMQATLAAVFVGLAAWPLLTLLAPGFNPAARAEAVLYFRLLLPCMPLTLFCALAFAHAALRGDLRPQAWSSALCNTLIILAAVACLGLAPHDAPLATGPALCAGVLAAFLALALWAARCLAAYAPVRTRDLGSAAPVPFEPAPFKPVPAKNAPAQTAPGGPARAGQGTEARAGATDLPARAFTRSLPVAVLGAAPHQIHALAAAVLASLAAPGGVTALFFAERLLELPMGLAGGALALAALPALARLHAAGDAAGVALTVRQGLGMSLFLSLPATAGLLALALPLCAALFGHGAYAGEGVRLCAAALAGYAPALPALCAGRVLLAGAHVLGRRRGALLCSLTGLFLLLTVGGSAMALAARTDAGAAGACFALGCGLSAAAWANAIVLHRLVAGALAGGLAGPGKGACKEPGMRLLPDVRAPAVAAIVLGVGLALIRGASQSLDLLGLLVLAAGSALLWVGGFYLAGNGEARRLVALVRRRSRPAP